MIRNARFVPVVLVLAAALSACGSDDAETASPATTEAAVGTVAGGDGARASGADVLARFSTCGDVAPVVAQYIAGLQEDPSNAADEYGVICNWETPEGATSLSEIRSVEVLIEPGTGEVPAKGDLEAGKLSVLPDTAIEKAGGVAYTLPMTTAVAGVIVTTVETPEVKVTITGGQWDDMPSLDAPAAVSAAKQLIGL
ncbi:hypothetical protein [Prescottella equi]|uniref:hypothetical protein n=1 Tax=Rhodococcus hoagii TaxID=43767 RepID=UPI0007CD7ABA|nr:hypothetical protein [Prescottella equi]MBM9837329.1 hypothetical protein [Prescottella equi]NKT42220.1 hypothetical protein [Prescottella equi]ORM01326.1 hypothetical protein A5N72_19350 [Prescottella equi]BCN53449.1 hypothetical protein RE9425_18390 [Prescottella equi]BCN58388.1 hypothetical protein RE9427_17580 [Prescottella equi]